MALYHTVCVRSFYMALPSQNGMGGSVGRQEGEQMLSKRQLFLEAHRLTRLTMQPGDNYQATFGACLRHVLAWASEEPGRSTRQRNVSTVKRIALYLADAVMLAVLSLLVAAILAVLPAVTVADATKWAANDVYIIMVVATAAVIIFNSERPASGAREV